MRGQTIELVERDLKIFELIKKMGWIRQDNIAYYLGLNYENIKVNNIIRNIGYRLQKHGYIFKKRFLAGYPNYWCFTKLGAEFYGGVAKPKFVIQNIKHDDLVTRLLIQMLQRNTSGIKTEFEIKQEYKTTKKIPDLVVNNTAIEMELTQKSISRIRAIINEYRQENYDEVIYYTTPSIATIITELSYGDSKFKFKILDEINILNSSDFMPEPKKMPINILQLKERFGL